MHAQCNFVKWNCSCKQLSSLSGQLPFKNIHENSTKFLILISNLQDTITCRKWDLYNNNNLWMNSHDRCETRRVGRHASMAPCFRRTGRGLWTRRADKKGASIWTHTCMNFQVAPKTGPIIILIKQFSDLWDHKHAQSKHTSLSHDQRWFWSGLWDVSCDLAMVTIVTWGVLSVFYRLMGVLFITWLPRWLQYRTHVISEWVIE